jgi:hypothetical protein
MRNIQMPLKQKLHLHHLLDKLLLPLLQLRLFRRKATKKLVAELRRGQSLCQSPNHKSNMSRQRTFWETVTTMTSLRVFRSVK